MVSSVALNLPFLCAVWKFHKNPIKPRFICAASSTSLTEVCRGLSSFFKGVVEVINKLNLSRSEVDKASQLLLQSFDFLTLYTKIDLMDL